MAAPPHVCRSDLADSLQRIVAHIAERSWCAMAEDSSDAAPMSFGNYKGVMLCNRPFAGAAGKPTLAFGWMVKLIVWQRCESKVLRAQQGPKGLLLVSELK